MSAPPIALIDLLNELLQAEETSIFRFMGEGSPYLNRATVEVRIPLQAMVATIGSRTARLADKIERLGGVAHAVGRGVDREEQYLAFLSLKFLLPKLVIAKQMLIERYQNAVKSIRNAEDARGEVRKLLESLLAEHREQLKHLEQAAERVATQK